jgi:hypothetical protein
MVKQLKVAEVHNALEAKLRARPDLGLWRAFVNLVLEPPNSFDRRARRWPKKAFVGVSIMVIAGAYVFLYFNFL